MPAVKPVISRKERAKQTRLRITRAAHSLFAQSGYQATTMDEIAVRAGVAVQTVYFVFHTKAELLQAVFANAVLGEGGSVPPHEQDWFAELRAAPDAERAIELLVENVSEILRRTAAVAAVIEHAPDEDARAVWAHSERLRRDGYRKMVDSLAKTTGLAPGLKRERATDVLLVLLGPGVFHTLTAGHGWSLQQYRSWAASTLQQQLFGPGLARLRADARAGAKPASQRRVRPRSAKPVHKGRQTAS